MKRSYRAIGLMSGTSLDGIDAALIETDGEVVTRFGETLTLEYDPGFRARLRSVLGATEPSDEIANLEIELTDFHAEAVCALLVKADISTETVDLIGFHGQTINHIPDRHWTWQLGQGERLAAAVGIDTVFDLRSADVAAGGQGAPFAPVYHRALARDLGMPLVVLNLGGVGNITWLASPDADPIAFDTGPASALLDDWITQSGRDSMDRDGAISAAGRVDEPVLQRLLDNPYFAAAYPKSLDRNAFDPTPVNGLTLQDGAATLARFTVETVAMGVELLPGRPVRMLVTGGGRHNPTLMRGMTERLGLPVDPVEAVGWNGDALEAQAFAFMAVRNRLDLPISFPGTTGIAQPMTGGRFARAA